MGGLFGGGGKPKVDNSMAEAQMARIDKLDLPDKEKMRLILESPELVGLLEAEGIDPSKMGEISLDPELRNNQMKALESLQERSEQGLTASDKYDMEQLLGDVASQRQSAQAGIESQMARRGMDSSGAAERAQRENVQSSANNARDKAMQMAAMGQQNKMAALAQLGQQSGQMNQQDFARKSQIASAQDAIARANAMNRQQVSGQNLGARQAIENARVAAANQQQIANKGLEQQQFNNEVSKLGLYGGVKQGAAAGPEGPSTGAKLGTVAGGVIGGIYGGPAGAGAGASAGGSIGGALFEDGGVVSNESMGDSMPIQYRQTAMNAEYREKETKQHEGFKKKYMKRIQDEVMGASEKPKTPAKPEGKTGHEGTHKLADGGLPIPNEDMYKPSFIEEIKNKLKQNPGNDAYEINELKADRPADEMVNDYYTRFMNESVDPKIEGLTPDKFDELLKTYQEDIDRNYSPNKIDPSPKYANGGPVYASDGMGDIVDSGMESYAGDRVDAKLNDKEIVVNVPQQQRLMDLLRGKISVDELGSDDIVEGVPREFRDDMHEELDEESEGSEKMDGLMELMKMLEK